MSEKEKETKLNETTEEKKTSSDFDEISAINVIIHELCEESDFPLTKDLIEKHFNDLPKNLEEIFKASLDVCIQAASFEQARKIVTFLDNSPYINQGVEEIIREYPKKIEQSEAKYIASLKRGSTEEEDTLKELISPESLQDPKNTSDLISALYSLNPEQVRKNHDDILKITTDAAGYLARVTAFLILLDCGYTDLSLKNKKGFIIKPTKNETDRLLDTNPSKEINDLLMSITKDVSLSETGTSLYSLYYLYTFPEVIKGTKYEIGCALHIASRYYMQVNDGLKEEDIAKIWNVDLRAVFPILEGIIEADESLDPEGN